MKIFWLLVFLVFLVLPATAAEFKNLVKIESSEKAFELSDHEKKVPNKFPEFLGYRFVSFRITSQSERDAHLWLIWYSQIPEYTDTKMGKVKDDKSSNIWSSGDGTIADSKGNDPENARTWKLGAGEPLVVRSSGLFINDSKKFKLKPRDYWGDDFTNGEYKGWILLVMSERTVIGMKASSDEMQRRWVKENPWINVDAKFPKVDKSGF